jgi:hypothetical protein
MDTTPDIIERGLALGLSKKTIKRMLDEKTFKETNEKLPSRKDKAMENPNHHMIFSHGKFYFKLVFKGVCYSKPLSSDEAEARTMRDQYLKEYGYAN